MRELFREFIHEVRHLRMSIDALNSSVATLSTDTDALIAALVALQTGSVPQAQVDAAQAAVDAIDVKVKAATPVV
jgi:hypothetical protein